MKKRTGVAAFGLGDTVSSQAGPCQGSGFFLADVVLPQDPLGALRAGKEAEAERVHSGLSWPKEAQIELGKPLRRVPVPCAWNLFVEAGDTTARWNVRLGSFPLADRSCRACLHAASRYRRGADDADELVVTIPDHLAEYGQTALLQELRHRLPRSEIRLLWRPVAAALTWLEAVRGDLGTVDAARDWLAVVYLGADGIECTGFEAAAGFRHRLCSPRAKTPCGGTRLFRCGLGRRCHGKPLALGDGRSGGLLAGLYGFSRGLAGLGRQALG